MIQEDKAEIVHVAAGLLLDSGRVLIAKRPKGSHLEGLWEFPGGKREVDETLKECLEREITEELGVRIKVEGFLLRVNHDYGSKMIALHLFECRVLNGEPRSLEGQEIRWVYPSDLTFYDFPEPDLKLIELLSMSGILQA